MSSTQCKDTKSYEHVNEHTTRRNILTENYHTQQENADSIKAINLVSDILFYYIESNCMIIYLCLSIQYTHKQSIIIISYIFFTFPHCNAFFIYFI